MKCIPKINDILIEILICMVIRMLKHGFFGICQPISHRKRIYFRKAFSSSKNDVYISLSLSLSISSFFFFNIELNVKEKSHDQSPFLRQLRAHITMLFISNIIQHQFVFFILDNVNYVFLKHLVGWNKDPQRFPYPNPWNLWILP